jgi:O-antigen/teichoic acid export membrane protein
MMIKNNLDKLKNNPGVQKYLANTSWLFGEKILRMALGLVIGVWVTRFLGPEQFGLFSYIISFVGIFTIFSTLGLDSIVVRELVKNQASTDIILGTAFTLKLIGALLVCVGVSLISYFTFDDKLTSFLVLLFSFTTIFHSFNVIDFYFQSKVLSKFVTHANVVSLITTSIIKIVLIYNQASLVHFIVVAILDSLIIASGLVYFYCKNGFSLRQWKFDRVIAINLLKDSWPLIFSGFVISIYMKLDQMMLKNLLNSEAVGQYAAAVRLSEVWYFIPVAICSSMYPAIINSKNLSDSIYYERLQTLYRLLVWMAILIAIPITFTSDVIIRGLYGIDFNDASIVLTIHIWTSIFVFFGVAWSQWMTIENMQGTILKIQILSLLSNIALNMILIPEYGPKGAALATLISYSLGHTVFALLFKNQNIAIKMFWKSFKIKDGKL